MRATSLALAALLAGCGSDFKPASFVDKLRVLAIRADPPDLHPGDTAQLSALVVDPAEPRRRNTVLYLACDPDPRDLAENPCLRYANLDDPSAVLQQADGGTGLSIPGARVIGVNELARYTAPADLFGSLPPGDFNRQRGVLAVVLALAVAKEVPIPPTDAQTQALMAEVKSKQVASILAMKRIRISEDPDLNHNPELSLVATGADLVLPDHPLRLAAGARTAIEAIAGPGAVEPYVAIGPDGSSYPRTEQPVVSWFTTSGRLDSDRTLGGQTGQAFTAPDGSDAQPIPGARFFDLWTVLRDGRGGVDWQALRGFVCDPSLPAPTLAQGSIDPEHPDLLRIEGSHLDQVLDVTLDGLPIDASYDPRSGAILGRLPAGAHGTFPIVLRGKNCQDTAGQVAVP